MGMRIAIVGMSGQAKGAPYLQPDWEVWGMAFHPEQWAYFNRVFEMHDMSDYHKHYNDSYIDKLKEMDNLYMQEKYFDNVTPYPFDEVGNKYFSSTIGYMMALAISMKPEEIHFYGINMADDTEYRHQRPNVEYFVGLAEGRDIKVVIPDSSPVMKYQPGNQGFDYTSRYGWTQ
jgi:hypothetical protein